MQYLSPYKLKELIRHYSEFVTHPVSLRQIKIVKVPKEKDEFEEDDESKKDEGEDDFEVTEEKEPEMEEVRRNKLRPRKKISARPLTTAHLTRHIPPALPFPPPVDGPIALPFANDVGDHVRIRTNQYRSCHVGPRQG